jgi:ATP-binding cassette, subfamily B, bacterial MsbA
MNKSIIRWLAQASRQYPVQSLLLVVISILSSVADGLSITLLIPLLTTIFENQGFVADDAGSLVGMLDRLALLAGPDNRLFLIAGLIVGLVTVRSVLMFCDQYIVAWMSGTISHQIRSRIFANLLGSDFQFISTNDNGKLLNTLDGEAWNTTDAITSIFGLFTNLCMVLSFTAILLFLSWKLTLLVAVLVTAISTLRRLFDARMRRMGHQMIEASEDLYNRSTELFDSMRMIRAFGRENDAQRAYDRASTRLFGLSLRVGNLANLASGLQEVLYAIIFAGIIFAAIGIGVSGAALIAFLALLHRVQPHVKQFDETRTHLQTLTASVEAVTNLLDLPQWSGRSGGGRQLPALRQGVRFDCVSFSYAGKSNERRNALEALTLEIPFGQTTAIVGSSGAGKSTLTNLLFRFHDPDQGRVTVDGVSLDELDLDWWRSRLSIAGQDTDLISGSLRENIAYGKPDASDAAIERATRAAQIYDFIASLPYGLDTQIGTRGVLLSGGQRQRIQLARALLRDDGILILDEATNALDAMTEHEILEVIEGLHGKRTIVLISHRLSATMRADRVVVLGDGKVVEQGSPDQLLQAGELFASMVKMQEFRRRVAVEGG